MEIKGEAWAQFAAQDPRLAALIQTQATKSVLDTEHHLGDLDGTKKLELATNQTVEGIQNVIRAGSPFFGSYAPAALAVAELLPHIVNAIKGIVDWFNATGDFQHKAAGVA